MGKRPPRRSRPWPGGLVNIWYARRADRPSRKGRFSMTTATRFQVEPIMTLPGRYYYDPNIFEQEQQRIFSESWVCVGRADALPAPGHFFLTEVGVESVVVSRAGDG